MNYNIKMDLLKLRGARIEDGCVLIPLVENAGCLEVSGVSCYLSLAAFELREQTNGQSHLVKPSLSRAQLRRLSPVERMELPYVGNMKPWLKDTSEAGMKADVTKCRICPWGQLLTYASGALSIRCTHPGAPQNTTSDVHYISCPKSTK